MGVVDVIEQRFEESWLHGSWWEDNDIRESAHATISPTNFTATSTKRNYFLPYYIYIWRKSGLSMS